MLKIGIKDIAIRIGIWAGVLLFMAALAEAHPTGNMITVGNHVLWSYIHPVDEPGHYACVMIWEKGSGPKVFFKSEHAGSDFMLFNKQDDTYLIERRFLQSSDEFQIRVLKSRKLGEPQLIWDWFKDEYRIGEGGFFMLSDDQMVFGKYPDVLSLIKGKKPTKHFEFKHPVNRIRAVENGKVLLLGEVSCYLVRSNGSIIQQWNNLIDHSIKNAPLNRNQIFDADYSNGELLLAYWGKRSFDIIDSKGKRKTLIQQTEPLTPHWLAFWGKEKLLFSSQLIFDRSTPKPQLTLVNETNQKQIIWGTK